MRPLRSLLIYAAAVFLGAALLAPWLYWLVQTVGTSHPFFQKLAAQPFHSYVQNLLFVLALIGLRPLFRQLGANSWREIGLGRPAAHWSALLTGLFCGLVTLALVAIITIAVGARAVDIGDSLAPKIFTALMTAIIVAVLEEILFRGGVFGGLRRVFDWRFALVLSSVVYALTHFLKIGQPDGAVAWSSGFALLAQMPANFIHWPHVVPMFSSLLLAGLLLGLAYQRTGNLYFSIGLHAGWIFWLKIFGAITRETPGTPTWFWGGGKMIDGWLAVVVLALALFAFTRWPRAQKRRPVA